MRKIIKIFLFGVGICISHNTYAQSLVNGEFNNPNPLMSQYVPPTFSCVAFDNGYLPNWYRSHGTPDLAGSPLEYMEVKSVKDPIDISEGVVGGYDFHSGIAYTIEMDVTTSCISCPSSFSNTFNIYATNSIVEGTIGTDCLAPIPAVASKQLIDSRTFSSGGSPVYNHYTLSFTPSADYHQIWIHTSNPTNPGIYSYAITNAIDYIRITSCNVYKTKWQTYFSSIPPDNATPPRNPGPYITGSGSSAYNDPNNNTTLVSTYILMTDVTTISAAENHYFLAVAVTDCSVKDDPYVAPLPHGPEQTHTGIAQFETNQLSVYPNPTSGSFKIKLGVIGDYHIRVVNTMGTTVYQTAIKNSKFLEVSDTGLPTGIYTVYVTNSNEDARFVEKINIAR
ncbi:MAG: T9SS type A sorting domain-containing protein [Sphingobacteriales bacterium]|nr:MAG: T9SS type A sorting domain-containing protein [Sphingobacteriales bacterium]